MNSKDIVLMYVDVMFGITLKANSKHDMDCAAVIIRQLLGHGEVAEDKSAWGRILDILVGWTYSSQHAQGHSGIL